MKMRIMIYVLQLSAAVIVQLWNQSDISGIMDGINCFDFRKEESSDKGVHQYNLNEATKQLWKNELQQLSEEKQL